MEKTETVLADYTNKQHQAAILYLMDCYATDPMGGGQALSDEVKNNLIQELSKRDTVFSILAFVDGQPAGLINCIEGFSTFNCKPLINIHDVVVAKGYRKLGLSHKMLAEVEQQAINKGCCKLTLEVLQGNGPATESYQKFGFNNYQLDPKMGNALFLEKKL